MVVGFSVVNKYQPRRPKSVQMNANRVSLYTGDRMRLRVAAITSAAEA